MEVFKRIWRALSEGFSSIVMMPTGSGKTIVEMMLAKKMLEKSGRVLVIEPTRFLADQMKTRWGKEFGSMVSKTYEGDCSTVWGNLLITTPITAKKCLPEWGLFQLVLLDEVHHAVSSKSYSSFLEKALTNDNMKIVGFTALVNESRIREKLAALGLRDVSVIKYDFKGLEALGGYVPPVAIADFYDAVFNEDEELLYEALRFPPLDFAQYERRLHAYARNLMVKYGYTVACRFIAKYDALQRRYEQHCSRIKGPPHKLRSLLEVLDVFGPSRLHPVIIFSWSAIFAREASEYLENNGLGKVFTLTGDLPRAKRLELLDSLKKSDEALVLSTMVGEEGFDLPDAGLLVLIDVPSSVIRFYQRLGRLLRRNPRHVFKYLAIVSTPETHEYDALPDVIARLHREGVDVQYVLSGIEEILRKGSASGLEKTVYRYIEETGTPGVPFILMRRGIKPARGDLVEDGLEKLIETTAPVLRQISLIEPYDPFDPIERLLGYIISYTILGVTDWTWTQQARKKEYESFKQQRDRIRKTIRKIDNVLTKGKYTDVVRKAIIEGDLLVAADVQLLSDTLAPVIKFVAEERNAGRLTRKPTLLLSQNLLFLLTASLVPYDRHEELLQQAEKSMQKTLDELALETSPPATAFCYTPKTKKRTREEPKMYCLGHIDYHYKNTDTLRSLMRLTLVTNLYNRRHKEKQLRLYGKTLELSLILAWAKAFDTQSQMQVFQLQ